MRGLFLFFCDVGEGGLENGDVTHAFKKIRQLFRLFFVAVNLKTKTDHVPVWTLFLFNDYNLEINDNGCFKISKRNIALVGGCSSCQCIVGSKSTKKNS